MIRALKSYWAYASTWYKLVMLVGVPIVWVVGYVLTIDEYGGDGLTLLYVLMVVEATSDFFFMNGAYSKGGALSNFMQSSSKFPNLMKEVSAVDIVRRVLVLQIPLLMEVIYAMGNEDDMQWCKVMAFWTWMVIPTAQIAVFVARHFIEFAKTYFCVTMGFIILLILSVVIGLVFEEREIVVIPFFMVAFLIMSIVTVWYTGKKAKECYYD